MQNKEDQIWVTISRTINLGNYSNVKIEVGASQTVISEKYPIVAMSELCDEVFEVLKEKGKKYKKELKKTNKSDSTTKRIKKPWIKHVEDLDAKDYDNPNS
jgi:phosphosulfolactate synthase (CoM biosynthesis protein A)